LHKGIGLAPGNRSIRGCITICSTINKIGRGCTIENNTSICGRIIRKNAVDKPRVRSNLVVYGTSPVYRPVVIKNTVPDDR
jgi:hypothetical protein